MAKGKLVDKTRNLLRNTFADKSQQSEIVLPGNLEETLMSEEKLQLDNKIEPWEEVIIKWQKTFNLRTTYISQDVDNLFNHWPILNDPRSVHLIIIYNINNYVSYVRKQLYFQITIDFDTMFPEDAVDIREEWFSFMEKLISLKKSSVRNQIAHQYFEIMEMENTSEGNLILLFEYT